MRLPIALAILCATTTAFADEYSNLSHSISGAWGALADGSYALVGLALLAAGAASRRRS